MDLLAWLIGSLLIMWIVFAALSQAWREYLRNAAMVKKWDEKQKAKQDARE